MQIYYSIYQKSDKHYYNTDKNKISSYNNLIEAKPLNCISQKNGKVPIRKEFMVTIVSRINEFWIDWNYTLQRIIKVCIAGIVKVRRQTIIKDVFYSNQLKNKVN